MAVYTVGYGPRYTGPQPRNPGGVPAGVRICRYDADQRPQLSQHESPNRQDVPAGLLLLLFQVLLLVLAAALPLLQPGIRGPLG